MEIKKENFKRELHSRPCQHERPSTSPRARRSVIIACAGVPAGKPISSCQKLALCVIDIYSSTILEDMRDFSFRLSGSGSFRHKLIRLF
jgi:hypothetical protein